MLTLRVRFNSGSLRINPDPLTLHLDVEYAERGKEYEYGILFIFSLFCEYMHLELEYARIHVIFRVNQAEN